MNSPWNGGLINPLTMWLGLFGLLVLYWIVAVALF